jgi:hypothetical protein
MSVTASPPGATTPLATRWTTAGLALVALSTLMYEVLLTRIFSVTMWYHFAFVAISIAMFGMTVGALVVYLRPSWFPRDRVKRQLAIGSALFPIVTLLSFLTQLSIPFRVHPSIVAIYAIVFTYAVIAVPFVLSGVLVSLVLTRYPRDVGRLYAADLIGAALGCILLVWVLAITDGPTAVLVICALAALGALAFALDEGSRPLVGASSVVAALLLLGAVGHTALVWRGFPVLRILYVKAGFEARPLYERWNSYSRIRVEGNPNALEKPYTWGLSRVYPADRRVNQLHLDIDVAAGTVLTKAPVKPEDIEHLEYDVTNIGYYLRPKGRALVVGVGGGRDVLSALHFGASSVVGVEINTNILETLNGRFGDFTGHLDRHPRVTFVNDEARSYIARQNQTFDVIQISLIDTWAATAAGAFVLSENSLYTVEAWELFLRHLEPGGVLSVSRWYFRDRPGEVYRMTALASAALTTLGVANPQAHMAIVRSTRGEPGAEGPDGIGTLLVSPTPFSPADLATLGATTDRLRFDIVLSPTHAADKTFAALASGRDLDAFTAAYPINIAPPTDDSPFFFNMLRLRDVLRLDLIQHGKSTHNMEAVFVLGTLLFTVALLTGLCIVLPLLVASDRRALQGSAPLVLFFAAIGLGFMLVETSQMQRLIVVLGHPTYGLTVVLFSLLLASGVGSWLTTRLQGELAGRSGLLVVAALVVVLFAFGLATPALARRIEGASTAVRIVVSALVLAAPGVLMGMAFPLGMRLSNDRAALTPWLWGVNGATSVCASVLAVAIALSTTISMAFWAGWLCYAAALGAFAWQVRRARVSDLERTVVDESVASAAV